MTTTAAHLEILPETRGLITQIVFRDETRSQFLVTKNHAFENGEAQVGIKMTKEEWSSLKREIGASSMLNQDSELEEWANHLNSFIYDATQFIQRIKDGHESFR